jgi:CRISPR/Cas system-associated exonuclease Cas4 (RecB family)
MLKRHEVLFNQFNDYRNALLQGLENVTGEMADHIRDFITCSHRFLFKYVKKEHSSYAEWRTIVQSVVNRVVYEFYKVPPGQRTSLYVLQVLEKQWKSVPISIFESKAHYYTVLAQLTDYLLHYLLKDITEQPPLFLYEKMQTYMEELGISISLTLELGEWAQESFVIKKYIVDANESMIQLFWQLTAVFSYKAFDVLPKEIEIISLLEGKSRKYRPKKEDIRAGIEYLHTMKQALEEPMAYGHPASMTLCSGCAFQKECQKETRKQGKEWLLQ